ncbi:hypothetical protein EDD37DRAFT_280844 [Exophiala viscosa]|uniref:uncharacterized protein n=1 Tax=Exophiala viscosa TaxID=2486360 RepID=UPI002199691F|nr:hypothetical protein EDD37DRAFT_280844 [Exophiala viscosa]
MIDSCQQVGLKGKHKTKQKSCEQRTSRPESCNKPGSARDCASQKLMPKGQKISPLECNPAYKSEMCNLARLHLSRFINRLITHEPVDEQSRRDAKHTSVLTISRGQVSGESSSRRDDKEVSRGRTEVTEPLVSGLTSTCYLLFTNVPSSWLPPCARASHLATDKKRITLSVHTITCTKRREKAAETTHSKSTRLTMHTMNEQFTSGE